MLVALGLASGAVEGQPTGPAFRVNTYTTGVQRDAAIASAPNGAFVIAWNSFLVPAYGTLAVRAQRFDPSGNALGPEFTVDSGTGDAIDPSIATDEHGNFVIVYSSYYAGQDIFGQRFDGAGGRLGTVFRVNTATTGEQRWPAVASADDGSFVVAWNERSPLAIYAQRFSSSGSPLGTQFLVEAQPSTYQAPPSVASHSSGDFIVVWTSVTQDGSYGEVWGRRFATTGEALGPEFRVNTYTTGPQQGSTVGSGSNRGFIVMWVNGWPSLTYVYAQRFDAHGSPAGAEYRVSSYQGWNQPAVSSNAFGNFVVTWDPCSAYICAAHISGRRFSGSGLPLGAEFTVDTIAGEARARIALSLNGDFVVAWHAPDYDHSFYRGLGVYARRYGGGAHGDVDGDGDVDVTDVLALINFLFAGGPPPVGAADTSGDGVVSVEDVLYLINHLFAGGPAPL